MNNDQVKGKVDEVAGRAKRQVGEWTGDTESQVKGAAQEIKGKVQNAWGNAKDAVRAEEGQRRKSGTSRRRKLSASARKTSLNLFPQVDAGALPGRLLLLHFDNQIPGVIQMKDAGRGNYRGRAVLGHDRRASQLLSKGNCLRARRLPPESAFPKNHTRRFSAGARFAER